MPTVDNLLDEAKKAVQASNDTELAKALGIRPAAVSNYRRGVSLPNPVVCATLAGLTGEPLAKVLGIVGEARAISSDEKAVWRKLAATAMALLICIGTALPDHAKASQIQKVTMNSQDGIGDIMRNWPCPQAGARPAIPVADPASR